MPAFVKTPKGTELPLMDLQGKNYMTVQWRVVWFREEKPGWAIETEPVRLEQEIAIFKASIKDDTGRVISTSHGSETLKGFPLGYIEKAETVAVGRALANCGYGTAFAAELDQGEKLVDSQTPPQSKPINDPRNPGQYTVSFGKYKDRSLEDIGLSDVKNYVSYIQREAKEKHKLIGGAAKEFIEAATLWIEQEDKLPV